LLGLRVRGNRSLRRLAVMSTALLFLLALAACGGSSESEGEEGEETPSTIPASLDATESDAEDIVDRALGNDRDAVRAKAAELKEDAADAAAPLSEADVPEQRIDELRTRAAHVDELAVGDADTLEIALAANDVSALMPEMFARFDPEIPADVLALDYLDREAQLRSLAHEDAKVSTAVDELERTWAKLRPEVESAGGDEEAADFADHVAAMKKLRDSHDDAALQKEAVRGLELVDVLERVFA
jgi:hypothetical protein